MEAMVFFRQFVFFLILKLFNIFQKYSIKVIQALNFQPKPRHSIRRKYERFRVIFPLITIFRFLIFVLIIASLALLGVHSLDSARGSAAVRGLEAEVDVLLRVEAHDEGGDVDELLAHPDVTLTDQNASVVDRLGKSEFEDLSLQTTFQKIFNTKTQNVIQLHFGLVQHAHTHQTTEERISFEEPSRVLLLEGEQNSGRFSNLGESEFDSPDFAFVAKSKLADELQLLVETLLLKRTTRRRVRLRCLGRQTAHFNYILYLKILNKLKLLNYELPPC